MESEGATLEDLLPVIAGKVGREAYLSGDIDLGTIACGQAAGRIKDITSTGEIITDIMDEGPQIIQRLARMDRE